MSSKIEIMNQVLVYQQMKKNVSFVLSHSGYVYEAVSVIFVYDWNSKTIEKLENDITSIQEWLRNAQYKTIRHSFNFAFDNQDLRVKILDEKYFDNKIEDVVDYLYSLNIDVHNMNNSLI